MYKASIENWGDSRYLATTRHASFAMDTQGKGASPVDTLLAALGGCVGHYLRDFLRDRAVPAGKVTVELEATTTADRSRLAGISVRIDLGEARLDAALEPELLAFIERCPIHGTLRHGCPIEIVLQRRDAARPGSDAGAPRQGVAGGARGG